MISRQDLLDAGYRHTVVPTSFRYTHDLYQKRICGEPGATRYFVNFWWYSALPGQYEDAWESECHMSRKGDAGDHFTVSTHCWRDATVADVEEFYDKVHRLMDARNYEDESA